MMECGKEFVTSVAVRDMDSFVLSLRLHLIKDLLKLRLLKEIVSVHNNSHLHKLSITANLYCGASLKQTPREHHILFFLTGVCINQINDEINYVTCTRIMTHSYMTYFFPSVLLCMLKDLATCMSVLLLVYQT